MERLFSAESRLAKAICLWMCDHRCAAARMAVWLRPDMPPAIAREAVRHTWASYSETYRRVIAAAEAASWVPALRVPMVLVAGDHDPLVDVGYLQELAATFRLVSVRICYGARHDLPIAFADYCREVVTSVIGPVPASL